MKIGSVILGFVMILIGIFNLAGQAPVLGIHPAVWFILGVLLICSDSVWEKLAHRKKAPITSNRPSRQAPMPRSHRVRGIPASPTTIIQDDFFALTSFKPV